MHQVLLYQYNVPISANQIGLLDVYKRQLTTLIRGQKLPIFSGNGLPHDQLAAQIVQQASLGEDSDEEFAIVFAAMGVKYDVADFFRRTFEESGVSSHVAMFINLANDPVVERLITPKVALTLAEYLAFEKGMHILVILTDMTSFAEAMREVSSSKGEIPSRKGYPGYLYLSLIHIFSPEFNGPVFRPDDPGFRFEFRWYCILRSSG